MERPQLSPFNDKTLLFRGWSIRKLGLCVKGKGITIYGGLGLSYVKKVCACPASLSLRRGGRVGFASGEYRAGSGEASGS